MQHRTRYYTLTITLKTVKPIDGGAYEELGRILSKVLPYTIRVIEAGDGTWSLRLREDAWSAIILGKPIPEHVESVVAEVKPRHLKVLLDGAHVKGVGK